MAYTPRFSGDINELLENNRNWAKKQDESMFTALAAKQCPKALWIGCSDSRVPETKILDLMPGDLFVHRNIANVVSHDDLSVRSVVQFAVEELRVEHIIVCGTCTFKF